MSSSIFGSASRIVAMALCLAFARESVGQGSAGELSEMRKKFLEDFDSASAPVTKIYIDALRELEVSTAAERDYEAALAAQTRRKELESLVGDASAAGGGEIILLPADARTTGKVQREVTGESEVLSEWKSVGSSATWEVQRVVPGQYTVRIEYSCGSPKPYDRDGDGVAESERFAGGKFTFEEVTNLAGAAENHLPATVESTGGWGHFKSLDLGDIELQRTSSTFRIAATSVDSLGLMSLRRVQLIPKVGSPFTPGVESSFGSAQIESLRDTHGERLSTLRIPIAKKYIDDIRAIIGKLPSAEKSRLAPFIEKEALRAMELARTPPELPKIPKGGISEEAAAVGSEELETLVNARWIPHPDNLGDTFMVEQAGKKFRVRSYFVSCPTPGDRRSADYFGIGLKDVGFISEDAARFTTKYLADRDLTLVTAGRKDSEGNLLAVVSVRGIGIFGRILVARGLARINPDLRLTHGSLRASDYVSESLRPTEEEAKAEGRGAWSLGPDRPRVPRPPGPRPPRPFRP